MKLSELKQNETAFISSVGGSSSFHLRLEEMGFVPGQEVTRVYTSPFGSPIVFSMLGQKVALRRGEARLIEAVGSLSEVCLDERKPEPQQGAGLAPEADVDFHKAHTCRSSHCGSCPCCGGKSANRQRRRGSRRQPQESSAGDAEARHAADEKELTIALVGNPNCGKTAFYNEAAGGHERTGNYAGVTVSSVVGHTYFEGQNLRVVDLPGTYSLRAFSPEEAYVANELSKGEVDVVINVLDVTNLERNLLLTLQLQRLKLPMVGVLNMYDEFRHSNSRLDIAELERRLGMKLIPAVAKNGEGVKEALRAAVELAREAASGAVPQETAYAEAADLHAAVHDLLDGVYELREGRAGRLTARADRLLAQSPLAYLIFFLVMGLIFYVTFEVGAYPMDWMESGVAWLSDQANARIPEGWLRDLLVSGVLGGVGSVIVFLPNILILYLFISVLEDTGYLARAAFLADPLLRRVGLHGKSFIPMIMGFGCNVPAVMATRTIESRKSRLITMMTLPFMSCSARLPVFTVLSGAFFPEHAALVMLCLYAGGILVSFVSAYAMNKVFRRTEESHFVMEMPPYRMPAGRGVLRHTWERARQYLRKMGGIILVASVVIWALGYFPQSDAALTAAEQQEQSCLGRIGHAISPALEPLGYDWRMGVGILSGVGAKELMVSTIGVLYNCPEDESGEVSDASLSQAMRESGTTSAAGLSYLVFALLYFPCLATIAAIKGESGRWRYAVFTAVYTTAVAYVMAFAVYRLALLWL